MLPPIDRRAVLAGAVALSVAGNVGPARAQAAQPNIIFIMADDLGYADVGCYGRPDIQTPCIDSIAARGVRFLQGYANSAVCSATRTGLITGRYQYRLPVGLEEPISVGRDIGLPPEHPTLPSLLKKAGYDTALVGKWHLGKLPKYGPLLSGYDHFWGYRGGAVDYFRHFGTDGKEDLWDGDTPVQQAGYMTELLGDKAVAQVEDFAKGSKPFLLSLHFSAPHWPWEAPGDIAESDRLSGPTLRHFDGGNQATYRRMVEAMDTQIGRVLATVEAHGLTRDAIVVFTSDNGGERFADTWPFTGIKTELLKGGLRIPAIVSWPARLPKAVTTDQVGISMDWLPTLLSAAGTVPDRAYPPDGIDLLPILTGSAPLRERSLFWRYKANAQRAARVGSGRRLQISQAARQHFHVQRRRGPAGTGEPQGSDAGTLRQARSGMAALERHYAAGDRYQLHGRLYRRAASQSSRCGRGTDESRQPIGFDRTTGIRLLRRVSRNVDE